MSNNHGKIKKQESGLIKGVQNLNLLKSYTILNQDKTSFMKR